MTEREPVAWITRGGKHIPIFADEPSEDEKKKDREIAENAKQASAKNDKPVENKYGFEVYDKEPEVEFTDSHWKEMAKLRKVGKFMDTELRREVDEKMYELGEEADEDSLTLFDKMQEDRVTDDEYWAAYHAIANFLGLKKKGK